jgi:hypothetical protein
MLNKTQQHAEFTTRTKRSAYFYCCLERLQNMEVFVYPYISNKTCISLKIFIFLFARTVRSLNFIYESEN